MAKRSIYPPSGSPPTGIFSSRGRQKVDSTEQFSDKPLQRYALTGGDKSHPASKSSATHQPPRTLKRMMGH